MRYIKYLIIFIIILIPVVIIAVVSAFVGAFRYIRDAEKAGKLRISNYLKPYQFN